MRGRVWRTSALFALVVGLSACGSATSHTVVAPTATNVNTPAVTVTLNTPTAMATQSPTAIPQAAPPCTIFPADNIWNRVIAQLPVDSHSAQYVASMGLAGHLHPDFGADPANGIPITTIASTQPPVRVSFDYASESDPGPYPIPANASIEGGTQSTGDRHVLLLDNGACRLYELFAAYPQSDGSWHAGSGAIWNLRSNTLRPANWTSADAAGLPILPGLVRYDEVASGVIAHAIRVTVDHTQSAYLWPARHQASSNTNLALPPMGLRLRLKASFDISHFPAQDQVILTALKQYGMIVADNGTSWFIGGAPDPRWNDDMLHQLTQIAGANFEAVDESTLLVDPNSAQAARS